MTPSRTRLALALVAGALVLTACGSSSASDAPAPAPATSAAPAAAPSSPAAASTEAASPSASAPSMAPKPAAGSFVTLAEYEQAKESYAGTDVVLFFDASWCSTCKVVRDNLTADRAAIPAGLTIVSVDYDNSDDLKRTYGITIQHTFVQVDGDGNELAKWSGSVTAQEIAEQTV